MHETSDTVASLRHLLGSFSNNALGLLSIRRRLAQANGDEQTAMALESVRKRLLALSRAEIRLAASLSGEPADMGAALREIVSIGAGTQAKDPARITFDGPAVSLPAQTIVPLYLLCGELALRFAAAYPDDQEARLSLRWQGQQDADLRACFQVSWAETGPQTERRLDETHDTHYSDVVIETAVLQLRATLEHDSTDCGRKVEITFGVDPE